MHAHELGFNTIAIAQAKAHIRGRRFGYIGAAIGFMSAYVAISYSLIMGDTTLGEAGLYYGSVAALFGLSCGVITVLVKKSSSPS